MRGAGGTSGGAGRFFIGLLMMVVGGYLFLNAVRVVNHFHWGYSLMSLGGVNVTSGMVLVPFMFGVGMIFYNAKNIFGWLLAVAALAMVLFGVITSLHFQMRAMSLFDLLTILVLFIGGIGLFLSSLRPVGRF